MKNTITILSLAVLFLSACTPKPLKIKIDPIKPKTVVFTQVIPDQAMLVGLTKSFGALDLNQDEGDSISPDFLNQLLESDARVWIDYDGISDTLFQVSPGLYSSISSPQNINTVYNLHVINDRGERLSATSVMLPRVQFDSVRPEVIIEDEDTTIEVTYAFEDLPGVNYYMINFYKKQQGQGLDINTIFQNGQNTTLFTDLVSDQTFSGKYEHTSVFQFDIEATDTIAVGISNISKEYFEFLDLRKKGGNLFSEITREPITYPSNVENGYGFFNTHYPHVLIFDLNEY